MQYIAQVTREGRALLVEFPDCPGCQTFAENADELNDVAREALEGWLEAHLVDGQVPPKPEKHASALAKANLLTVPIAAGLAAALSVRWARTDAGLSQKALAELAGVSQQQIAKLENPDENPTVGTLEKVAKALGLQLSLALDQPIPAESVHGPRPALSKKRIAQLAASTRPGGRGLLVQSKMSKLARAARLPAKKSGSGG